MLRILSASTTALAVILASSSLAYAQSSAATPASQAPSETDLNTLADARVAIVKAALQLTPDQEKLWPAVEDAIRSRARTRYARVASKGARVDELRNRSPIEVLRDRNPVEFLDRRSAALAERSAELKKLSDAWRPLYETLTGDQRRRLGVVAVLALRELRNAAEQRRVEAADDEEED